MRASSGERGIALVITLILLSVITFMAVTFLVVTRGERGNVSVLTEQTTARLASDAAVEAAKAELIAPMLAFNNPTFGLIVSTNYQSPWFTNGSASFLNVNYSDQAGAPLTGNNALQNLANMLILPRVPVFITNRIYGSNESRFYVDLNRNGRFDTNGWVSLVGTDGKYIDASGNSTTDPNSATSQLMTGDPEWVGILERGGYTPSQLNGPSGTTFPRGYGHSASNLFISRYSFLVVPSSMTLDINAIHNYSKQINANGSGGMGTGDYFLRNMGVGSYEINLAAFLTDLNTNFWPYPNDSPNGVHYSYDTNLSLANTGAAFDDAAAVLRYRYATNWFSLSNVPALFGNVGRNAFISDSFDGYSAGPLMFGFHPGILDPDSIGARYKLGWAGSDNVNHFFDAQDFFDPNKTRVGVQPGSYDLSSRLTMAGSTNSTYDRYTFYRLLSQLGTDSAPEAPKMNLNYTNIDGSGKIAGGTATNFQSWTASQFFTNAAIRMLADAGFGTTNILQTNAQGQILLHIRIYPENYYTPGVHRMLQLAANIFDSTTNRVPAGDLSFGVPATNGFPSVFRPMFSRDPGGRDEIYITGYTEVNDSSMVYPASIPFYDINDKNIRNAQVPNGTNWMYYGFPLVVGAKKGFPNFNQFAMQTDVQVTRRLAFSRTTKTTVNQTNQMYTVGLSNSFGIEAWNSYNSFYPRSLQTVVDTDITFGMTNEIGQVFTNFNGAVGVMRSLMTNHFDGFTNWPASGIAGGVPNGIPNPNANSFRVPLRVFSSPIITNATFVWDKNQFVYGGNARDNPNTFPVPHWWLNITTHVRFALIDASSTPNRIVDFVNLSSVEPPVNITDLLQRETAQTADRICDGHLASSSNPDSVLASTFCTNRLGNPTMVDRTDNINILTYGLMNQIKISAGQLQVSQPIWDAFKGVAGEQQDEGKKFTDQLAATTGTDFQSPWNPTRVIHYYTSWQANDPLVHYLMPDLTDAMSDKHRTELSTIQDSPMPNLGVLNENYRPWGANGRKGTETRVATLFNPSVKDPGVWRSDDWDFPSNKYPNIGWLGRVHRGTPWQTINLKAMTPDLNTWTNWTANSLWYIYTNQNGTLGTNYDFIATHPSRDYRLLDLFTTALNDNASRGQLSVNQSGLAAWSAVLSGVIVNTNSSPLSGIAIPPAGVHNTFNSNSWTSVARIVAGINRTRTNAFAGVGDLLNTPELTMGPNPTYLGTYPNGYWVGASPFLDFGRPTGAGAAPDYKNFSLNDEAIERIPQQIMSLLRNDSAPRFVIYAFGQALKPAEHSIYLGSGQFFGMVTNYQITAEVATRSVVHVEGAPASPHVIVDSYNVLGPY